jgi:hypothetical protein
MRTLLDDVDDLDRMVDSGAATEKILSQIRFIACEVAELEADYSSLAQSLAKARVENATLRKTETKRKDEGWNELLREEEEYQAMLRGKELDN